MSRSVLMAPDGPPATVMIVDDDRWTTRALSSAISDLEGFVVHSTVHSGADALTAYGERPADLVLMDINMPGELNGIAATAAIKRLDPTALVVILTTMAPGPGLARALEAGASAALSKSAADSEIAYVLRQLLSDPNPRLLRGLARDILISGDLLSGSPALVPRLSIREVQLLLLICEGLTYEEIAAREFLTVWTVRTHARNLREKLGAANLAQLVVRALQFRFYTP